ncbi:hypothetical protein T09_6083, partial [Trichinella sp. T9]
MLLLNILRFSRHITYVGRGDFNRKGKCTVVDNNDEEQSEEE